MKITIHLIIATIVCASVQIATSAPGRAPSAPAGFALIPGGDFTMGDALDRNKAAPQHKVSVNACYMQKKEVSKAEWDEVRAWGLEHGYPDLPEGKGKAANHPVYYVSWFAVVKWCNAKSEKEKLTPCYYTDAAQAVPYRTGETDLANPIIVKESAKGYRLPTEPEWEKAARGGLDGKRFPWGDTISHNEANFRNEGGESYVTGSVGFHPTYKVGDDAYTSPVGSFAPNGYGLYDMTGNVSEWCWDWYDNYPSGLEVIPRNQGRPLHRMHRGGSWFLTAAGGCRVADRSHNRPNNPGVSSEHCLGFRVVRSLVP